MLELVLKTSCLVELCFSCYTQLTSLFMYFVLLMQVQPWEVGLRAAAAAAALLASQSLGPVRQVVGAAAAGAALGVMGHQKGSLSASGTAIQTVLNRITALAVLCIKAVTQRPSKVDVEPRPILQDQTHVLDCF